MEGKREAVARNAFCGFIQFVCWWVLLFLFVFSYKLIVSAAPPYCLPAAPADFSFYALPRSPPGRGPLAADDLGRDGVRRGHGDADLPGGRERQLIIAVVQHGAADTVLWGEER